MIPEKLTNFKSTSNDRFHKDITINVSNISKAETPETSVQILVASVHAEMIFASRNVNRSGSTPTGSIATASANED